MMSKEMFWGNMYFPKTPSLLRGEGKGNEVRN